MYVHLQNKMCKELEGLEEKYRSGAEMSEGDLRKIDLLTHSIKSLATYIAMKNAEDRENERNGYNKEYMSSPNGANGYGYVDRYQNNRMRPNDNYPPYYQEERRW